MAERHAPIRSGDPIAAQCWLDDDTPAFEGDQVLVHAELSDVDEVAVCISEPDEADRGAPVMIHLSRVQAVALAGQIAWAATADATGLPWGHGADGIASS